MRERILTKTERKAIGEFFQKGKKSTIARMLRYRAKRFLPKLKEAISLLERLLGKES